MKGIKRKEIATEGKGEGKQCSRKAKTGTAKLEFKLLDIPKPEKDDENLFFLSGIEMDAWVKSIPSSMSRLQTPISRASLMPWIAQADETVAMSTFDTSPFAITTAWDRDVIRAYCGDHFRLFWQLYDMCEDDDHALPLVETLMRPMHSEQLWRQSYLEAWSKRSELCSVPPRTDFRLIGPSTLLSSGGDGSSSCCLSLPPGFSYSQTRCFTGEEFKWVNGFHSFWTRSLSPVYSYVPANANLFEGQGRHESDVASVEGKLMQDRWYKRRRPTSTSWNPTIAASFARGANRVLSGTNRCDPMDGLVCVYHFSPVSHVRCVYFGGPEAEILLEPGIWIRPRSPPPPAAIALVDYTYTELLDRSSVRSFRSKMPLRLFHFDVLGSSQI